jgi:hypothetical protein
MILKKHFILFWIFIIISCETKSYTKIEEEDFFEFYFEFYQNIEFQLGRVLFPLPGENKQEMGVLDTVYYWDKGNWVFLSLDEFNNLGVFEKCLEIDLISGSVIEHFSQGNNPGLVFIREFKKIEGIWYLVYMVEAL